MLLVIVIGLVSKEAAHLNIEIGGGGARTLEEILSGQFFRPLSECYDFRYRSNRIRGLPASNDPLCSKVHATLHPWEPMSSHDA